ncbi:MAG: TIGR04086 family membrane protein [Eubacteriales bacterium]|nr:TIGR04086 family membrane protein [Eubacteriales bacterium]MDD3882968.1 TIGR04086 family membrane protein [Eubacteriales bacterium]MDD4513485.1 TIGR04086 family membrane protein [Eubacteriales bacterium]
MAGYKAQGLNLNSFLKGLLTAAVTTVVLIILFTLLLMAVRVSDGAVRAINQIIKLISVLVGCCASIGKGGERGLIRGALIGCAYMVIGVLIYMLFSGQGFKPSAYLCDAAMGVAAGGVIGMLLSAMPEKEK